MNKYIFRFSIIFQFFIYIYNKIDTFNDSLKIILFEDNTCVFVEEEKSDIYKMKVNDESSQLLSNLSSISNIKNKTLIKISEEQFILFALDKTNDQLLYSKFNKSELGTNKNQLTSIGLTINGGIGNHTIKYINENNFLVFYIYNKYFYLYSIYLNQNNQGNIKEIELINQNYMLNTIDCDSYDGENIFCVYSIINIYEMNGNKIYSTIGYYSFTHISGFQLAKNEIKRDIAGPALLKLENNDKKQFLICYYEFNIINNNNKEQKLLYCQLFIQDGIELINEQLYFIGETSQQQQLSYLNFIFQHVIQLIKYEYTIYINLKFNKDNYNTKLSVLFITSIDLKLVIPYYLEQTFEIKNILVNDNYILCLKNENSGTSLTELTSLVQCPSNTLYNLTDDGKELILKELSEKSNSITSSSDKVYISFALDPLTYIYTGNIRNMGGLLYIF